MSANATTKSRGVGSSRPRASPENRAEGGGHATGFLARPHTGDAGVPARRGPRRWAWRLFLHQELLALALIIITVAASWLLARH
jgi:hypothetical protein